MYITQTLFWGEKYEKENILPKYVFIALFCSRIPLLHSLRLELATAVAEAEW